MAIKRMIIEIEYDDEITNPEAISEALSQAIHEGVEIPAELAIGISDMHIDKIERPIDE